MKLALLASAQSSCRKSTIILALLQYLTAQQHKTVSFKAGPDFLPFLHITVDSLLDLFTEAGKPALAECSGAMLLGEGLVDHKGEQ